MPAAGASTLRATMHALHLLRGPAAANPSFLATVDGGGTGTRLRLFAPDGRLVGEGEAGPSALSLGATTAWAAIEAALQQAMGGALDWSGIALGIGVSGAATHALAQPFVEAQPGLALLALDNDGLTTVLGAHAGKPGAVVAAGTGTVGMAWRADGSRQLVSGWGWRFGDEGSGAWLGRSAVALAQQAMDGRARTGRLAKAIWAHCGIDRTALSAWCRDADATACAALARYVFEVDDPAARRLLAQAAKALGQVARALDAKLPLAMAGSIGLRLADALPAAQRCRLVPAQGSSLDGALHLLRHHLGAPL